MSDVVKHEFKFTVKAYLKIVGVDLIDLEDAVADAAAAASLYSAENFKVQEQYALKEALTAAKKVYANLVLAVQCSHQT